jgi:hypothetical protein
MVDPIFSIWSEADVLIPVVLAVLSGIRSPIPVEEKQSQLPS